MLLTVRSLVVCLPAFLAASGFAADTVNFEKSLYPIFEAADCRACHNPEGVASGTKLQFPEAGVPSERIEAFGKSLIALVDTHNIENSTLSRKPTNRTPHAGGERIKVGSPDEAALKAWIQRLTQLKGPELAKALRYREDEAAGTGHERPTISVRRLTH